MNMTEDFKGAPKIRWICLKCFHNCHYSLYTMKLQIEKRWKSCLKKFTAHKKVSWSRKRTLQLMFTCCGFAVAQNKNTNVDKMATFCCLLNFNLTLFSKFFQKCHITKSYCQIVKENILFHENRYRRCQKLS